MKESAIESALVRRAKELGIYTTKFTSPSRRGVPDRIFVKLGDVLFLELKAPGEKPTKLQMREMWALRLRGANVMWTDDLEMGRKLLGALADERLTKTVEVDKELKVKNTCKLEYQ